MKKDVVDYMNELTSSNLNSLEQLISLQYRKFIQFYRLVKDYSDIITKVKYEFNSPSSLDVVLIFDTKRDLKDIKKELISSMEKSKYNGSIKVVKKSIYMSIILDED